jgi:S1-C subfamily serine protease
VTITEQGLRIARLTPGGPAERAGIRGPQITRQRIGPIVRQLVDKAAADVITAIDGQRVSEPSEFLSVIETKKPGDVVELTILREGRSMKISIRLGNDDSGDIRL